MPYANQPGWSYNTTCDNVAYAYTINYETIGATYPQVASVTPQPVYVVEEPDDSPLGWLRSQVGEICDLAHAA
jgi:hypothetical protein